MSDRRLDLDRAGGTEPAVAPGVPSAPDLPDTPDAPAASEAAGLWREALRDLRTNPLFVVPVLLILLFTVVAFFPQWFTDLAPRACNLARSAEPPQAGHWFGFDRQGCDLYTRTVYSTRASLLIALLVTLSAFVVAVVLGSIAGYAGRWVDTLASRAADIVFGIPVIVGALVVLNVVANRGILEVAAALVLFTWPPMFRLMRSTVLGVRETDFVQAARALGASNVRIIVRHVVPNALAPVIAYATVLMGVIISAEATITFLGAGLQLPALSWGVLLSTPPRLELLNTPHLLLPAVPVALTVLSFVLAGDALRDALDPKLR